MKKPTQKDIDKQVAWLKENCEKIRQYTAFGDNNWVLIDAEIEVLNREKTSNDYADYDDPGDEMARQYTSACAIEEWMNGTSGESPIENWKGLVKK